MHLNVAKSRFVATMAPSTPMRKDRGSGSALSVKKEGKRSAAGAQTVKYPTIEPAYARKAKRIFGTLKKTHVDPGH
jgi:hypothetical protein